MSSDTSSGNEMPLLTPVPKAARRLAAFGVLPTRRLGGRVYVITSAIHALGRSA